tara:strand:- start:562 stop:807 length:246 start_codon:yes stop_codon:yes gene_type:complete
LNQKIIDMVFTKEAMKEQEMIIKDFPELWKHYQPTMGNFQFSFLELHSIWIIVSKWIESKKDGSWVIIKEGGYFYLTSEWE